MSPREGSLGQCLSLTFQADQDSGQTEDVPHHQSSRQLRGDGLLDGQRDEVGEAHVLQVPHTEQREAHAGGADDTGVIGGALPDLHKLVSRHRKETRALRIGKESRLRGAGGSAVWVLGDTFYRRQPQTSL